MKYGTRKARFISNLSAYLIARLAVALVLGTLSSLTAIEPSWAGDLDSQLRVASREGRTHTVRGLLGAGANPNATSDFGENALYNAARFNHTHTVEILIAAGADVDLSLDDGKTPLMGAAINCSQKASTSILSKRPSLNRTDDEGQTALIHAAESGCVSVVDQLLEMPGIDITIRDNSGRTALEIASTEALIEVGGPYSRIQELLRPHLRQQPIPTPRKSAQKPLIQGEKATIRP